MAGTKIKHAIIPEQTTKKLVFAKRTESLFKKANELSTLCDVEIGIAMYTSGENDAIVWPSRDRVTESFTRFVNAPEIERTRKMVVHDTYLHDRVNNEAAVLRKTEQKNDKKEMEQLLNHLVQGKNADNLNIRQLNDLCLRVAEKLKMLRERKKELDKQHEPQPLLLAPIPPVPLHIETLVDASNTRGNNVDPTTWSPTMMQLDGFVEDKWFMETMQHNENNVGIEGEGGSDPGVAPSRANRNDFGGYNSDMHLPNDLNPSWSHIFSP